MSDQATTVLKGVLSEGTVAFHAIFAKAFRSLPVGVFLSQAYFWQESRKYKSKETHREIGGKQFFTKTAKDWFEETSLTIEQLARVREVLKSQEILEEMLVENPAKLYYHVNFNALVSVINRYIESGVSASVDNRNKNRFKTQTRRGKKPKLGSVKNQSSYNEESIESLKRVGESTPAPAENKTPETSEEKNPPLPKVAPKGFAPAAALEIECVMCEGKGGWCNQFTQGYEECPACHGEGMVTPAAPTHAVTTHDPEAPGIVTVDPLTLEEYDYSLNENGVIVVMTSKTPIGPIVFESKPSVAPDIAPPRRPATLLEAEKKIVDWILGDGLETVKHRHQVAKIKFEASDAEAIAAHYASIYTSTSPGSKAAFMADPVAHFENGLFKYLKNEQSFSRSTPKQDQNQPTRTQTAPARSNIQHLGGVDDAKYFQ